MMHEKNKQLVISIKNNGKSIPVSMNVAENMYNPQLIFGNLMTGSNFDDNKVRIRHTSSPIQYHCSYLHL